jgi:hypothetical protein
MSRYHHLTELASWMQCKARTLSYNDKDAALKHVLRDASHALDTSAVRVTGSGLKLTICNARGKARRMTLREAIAYRLLGNAAEIRA